MRNLGVRELIRKALRLMPLASGFVTQPRPTTTMARGSKKSYTGKQKRRASHIEKSYEKRGVSKKTAKARAWATVNKRSGGGKKKRSKSSKKK